ncbi:MAG TPA: DinB family protein [Pirellulales bacterium]|jgi:uncharacterized damage-inducible protein DinB
MTAVARLGELLHKAHFGPAWHGPAVAELLADITAPQAAAPAAVGSHSIWQLVLHVTAWKDEVCRRLSGPGRRLSPEENWPPIPDTSEAAWQDAVARLNESQKTLETAVAKLSDDQLVTVNEVAGGDSEGSWEELLHVLIHHDLYHAGQIAILKTAPWH